MPVTTPDGLITATDIGAQLHVPPANELPSVIVLPWQKGVLPVMAPGIPMTVTITVAVPHVVV